MQPVRLPVGVEERPPPQSTLRVLASVWESLPKAPAVHQFGHVLRGMLLECLDHLHEVQGTVESVEERREKAMDHLCVPLLEPPRIEQNPPLKRAHPLQEGLELFTDFDELLRRSPGHPRNQMGSRQAVGAESAASGLTGQLRQAQHLDDRRWNRKRDRDHLPLGVGQFSRWPHLKTLPGAASPGLSTRRTKYMKLGSTNRLQNLVDLTLQS